MKNLKVWQKLLVMGVILMLPFGAVTWRMVSSINTLGTEFARQESRGLEYYGPLLVLLKDLQEQRGLTSLFLSGDATIKGRLDAKRLDVERDVRALDEADQRLDESLHLRATWSELRDEIRNLATRSANSTPAASFDMHSQTIQKTIALVTAVGDASKLTLDPDLDSYYLMNVIIFQGPELAEVVAQARGLGSSIAANRGSDPAQIAELNRLAILMGFLHSKVDDSFNKTAQANGTLKTQMDGESRSTAGAIQLATDRATKLVASRGQGANATEYYDALTPGVESLFATQERESAALNVLLDNRISGFQWEIAQTLAWAGLGLLFVSAVGLFMTRDMASNLGRVVGAANQIAVGDLTVRDLPTTRHDEIGILAQAFDRNVQALKEMTDVAERIAAGDLMVTVTARSERDVLGHTLANMVKRLSSLVGEVQRSGDEVNTSVNEIAGTARQQQATAAEIAATTTQIGATSKQISATSKELVRTMNEVSLVAEESASLAGSGQAGVTRMEDTMRHVMDAAASINARLGVLNEKAGGINQVVTTITKVADQTNLLSLNAAIEAEKAGEYGRGFAVVATEIRRLADQTAVATYDIERMVKDIQSAVTAGVMGMDKFSEEVRRGMQEVQEVGSQLSQIIHQVQALAPRFEAVSEGMHAQATGAEQITESLGQLSDAAQQTVESLRQSNQVIDGLNRAAAGMKSSVSRFSVAA
jgi:methyl-accepting chemotaxis protein